MRPRNASTSPSLDDMAEPDPDFAYYGLHEALEITRGLAARPPPFLRRAHGKLRSTAEGRWLPPPPPSSVAVSLMYVESATATVDGLSASILRSSGQRVRSTIVGIAAEKSRGGGFASVAGAAGSAPAEGNGLPLGPDGRLLPLRVSAKVDAGATGQQGRSTPPDGPHAPAVTGKLPVMEHAAALGGPRLARLNSGSAATAVVSAPSSSGDPSASVTRPATGLDLSCALDDFDAWCQLMAEPSPVEETPTRASLNADSPVVLRVSARGYAPTRLILRRQRHQRVGPYHRLEGIVRLTLRRLRDDDQPAGGVAGGRRLVSASERRLGALVVVARVVWKTPYITWPLVRGLSDGAGVAVKDESTPRRNGELPSQRMWRLSRHPISSMAVRVDVRATTKKGVDLLKNHRRDLACPVCNVVVPRTGGAESAVTALNAVLAHMDVEHVRVRVEVESHSFTRPGRGDGEPSLTEGKGAPRPPLLFRASLLVTLRDGHPTVSPANYFFSRRHDPPEVAGGGASGDCAANREAQRRTFRRPRRSSQTRAVAVDHLSPASLPSPPSPADGARDARARYRNCNDGGMLPAAASDKLAAGAAAVAIRGKRKRTPPAGLGNVRLYRAGLNIPMTEAEALHGDLYDMSDVRWLERLDTDRMLDVSDVTVREVYYMRLWNSFIRPSATGFGVYGDLHMRLALVSFMRTHRALLERLSMWGLVLSHLHELYALGVLDCAGLLAVARAYREPPEGGGGGGGAEKGSGPVDGTTSTPSGRVPTKSGGSLPTEMGGMACGILPAVTGGDCGGGLPVVSRVGSGRGLPFATAGARSGGSSPGRRAAGPPLSHAAVSAPPALPASFVGAAALSPSAGGGARRSVATAVLPPTHRSVAPLRIVEVTDGSAVRPIGTPKDLLPHEGAAVNVGRKSYGGADCDVVNPASARAVASNGALSMAPDVSASRTLTRKGAVIRVAGGELKRVDPWSQQLTPRVVVCADAPVRSPSASIGVFAVEPTDMDAAEAARVKRQRVDGWSTAPVSTSVAPAAAAISASGGAGSPRRFVSAASGETGDMVVIAGPPARLPLPTVGGPRAAR